MNIDEARKTVEEMFDARAAREQQALLDRLETRYSYGLWVGSGEWRDGHFVKTWRTILPADSFAIAAAMEEYEPGFYGLTPAIETVEIGDFVVEGIFFGRQPISTGKVFLPIHRAMTVRLEAAPEFIPIKFPHAEFERRSAWESPAQYPGPAFEVWERVA